MDDPRSAAVRTLVTVHQKRTTAKAVWNGPRPAAETALVLGVLRRRATLDAIAQVHSTRKVRLLKPDTLAALRVGLFEMLYHDDAPDHAIVHAAVESAKRARRLGDVGFLNAMLRTVRRESDKQQTDGDVRRTLPRETFCHVFKRVVFPDPNQKPAAFLAARCSTASWIAARRLEELGLERALRCLDLQAATPPLLVRRDPRAPVAPLANGESLDDALAGGASVQDAVASQVALFLDPAPDARLLDFCAAPGGKATHLAQLAPQGEVTAWDIAPERLEKVAENAQRLGLTNLRCGEASGEYDGVLVDAPCSNTGVLARRPEARWRVKERHLKGMAERQLKILKTAAAFVRPGGTVVYSTCSLEPEENLGVVEAFLALRDGFALEEARTAYPDEARGDGGFMARLRAPG